jgi:hypothetical protein
MHLSDRGFSKMPQAKVLEYIDRAGIYRLPYIPEVYDCDNFARSLKARVDEYGAADGLKYGYAFGTIWGQFGNKTKHAVCWFVDETGKILLVEPQAKRKLWLPRKSDKGIWKFEA